MDYTKVTDYELNAITSHRAGRSRPAPYCGDTALALSLLRGVRFMIKGEAKNFFWVTLWEEKKPRRKTTAGGTNLIRVIVEAWNMYQDEKAAHVR